MNPRHRNVLWIALASLFGLMVAGVIVGIFVSQSQWFRDFVRTKIVQTVESSTGAKSRSRRSGSIGGACGLT